MTDDRLTIEAATVAAMVAARFPQWAGLPVTPVMPGGWDNRTFRLGETMSVRLPSAPRYGEQPAVEHAWLPRLAPHLPAPVPRSLALVPPSADWPLPWSVRAWLPGVPASTAPATDLSCLARDLARFLRALHAAPVADGPPPGPRNFHRGGDLAAYDGEVRARLDRAAPSLGSLWDAALAARFEGPPVWVHGDIAPGNLLLRDGRLAAVIDWGCCAVGDPACDLAIAWTILDAPARAAFRARVGLDDGVWLRARGWALWKALLIATGASAQPPGERPAEAVLDALSAPESHGAGATPRFSC